MGESEPVVKWLYPGAEDSSLADPYQLSDMESELQTDQSIRGSELDKSSPTSSGADIDTLSSEDLPLDSTSPITDIGQKVTAASSYVGNLLQSSWYSGTSKEKDKNEDKKDNEEEDKVDKGEKAAAAAPSASSSFTSAFFSTIGKVSGSMGAKDDSKDVKNKEEDKEKGKEDTKEKEKENSSGGGGFGYLTNAFSKIGISGIAGSLSADGLGDKEEKAHEEEKGEKDNKGGEDFLYSAFSKVGKAASSYTKVLQDTVYKAPMLSDFHQEQENFIKAKGDKDVPTAPWSGYQNEEDLKEKILALSLDQRNFLRAPPTGVEFDMESTAVSTHALVLLKEDARLETIRYQLVPKQIKEEDFWKNYFYRVGVLQQSFELNNIAAIPQEQKSVKKESKKSLEEDVEVAVVGPEHEDEFVSDSHQVSSKDMAEADEAMKKLGLDKEDAEWEAELEGELEYEMVQGEGVPTDNPEWEDQIQELLAAEDSK